MALFSKLFGGKAPEPGLGTDELARRLNVDVAALKQVPITYREMRLAKKSGGERILHVPDAPLKTLQKNILRRVLGRLAAHPSAMGFERGQSIATNAGVHVGATIVLKMDLKDFFTQTATARVREYFIKIGWGGEAADLLVKLTTHKGGLPQGAPTSPRLSNLVNYGLDARLFGLGLKLSAKYTRYADDMTFSFTFGGLGTLTQQKPKTVETSDQGTSPVNKRAIIAAAIRGTKLIAKEYGYVLHQGKKLQIHRRHDRMLVTGLVVNSALNLPRTVRKRLRAVEHRLKTGKPATMTAQQLQGWRAYAAMVAAHRTPVPPGQSPLA